MVRIPPLLYDSALDALDGQGNDDQQRGAGDDVVDGRGHAERHEAGEHHGDDELADDDGDDGMTVLLEGQAEERAHERGEVQGLGKHVGHRGLSGAVADVEDGHDAHEARAQDERDELVLVDVHAHVLSGELVGADSVDVGTDLGVLQDEAAQQERDEREDHVVRIGAEHVVVGVQTGAGPVGGEHAEALIDERQARGDDQRRNAQDRVGEAVEEAQQNTADDRGDDEAHDAEHLAEADRKQAGKHEHGADGEVPQALGDDEVHAAAADGVDERALKIRHDLGRRAKRLGAQHLEDRPANDREDDEEAHAKPLALLKLFDCVHTPLLPMVMASVKAEGKLR